MATLYVTRVQTGETVTYWQAAVGELVQLDTDIIPVARGWRPIDKATYDAALLACDGTGEVAPPVVVVPPPPLGFSTPAYRWDGDAFWGEAIAETGVDTEGYLEPLDGQAVPIDNFQFLPMSVVSDSIGGVAFNRAFYHEAKARGGAGVLPGRYTLYVRRAGESDRSRWKSISVVLSGTTGTGTADSWSFVGTMSVSEGGGTVIYAQKRTDGAFVDSGAATLVMRGARAGLNVSADKNAMTITASSNTTPNDSYTTQIDVVVAGKVVLTQDFQVLDATTGGGSGATPQFTRAFYEFVDSTSAATLDIARAFAGTNNNTDTLYFVKNGSTTDAPGIGFRAPGSDYLNGNNAMGAIAGFNYPSHWKFAFDAAMAAGYTWFGYAGIGNAGETVTARIRARRSDSAYQDFDYMRPIDGVNSSLTSVYSSSASTATTGTGAYAVYTQTQQGVPGWPANTDRVYRFSDSLTNDQADSQFLTLPLNDKLSQTDTAEPAVPAGKRKQTRLSVRTGPSWASLRYSLSQAGELYLEGAGTELAKLRFKRADGTPMSGSNRDGVTLNDTDFYGYGDNSDAAYPKQWKAVFTPAVAGQNVSITAQRTNGETFEHVFVPVSGASKVQLYVAATVTTTPTTPGNGSGGSYKTFVRGVIVGNSITTHTASTALNWPNNNGMAASAPDKDYAHVVENALKAVSPTFTLAKMGQGSGLELGYNSSDADAVTNTLNNLNYELGQLNGNSATYDLIILSIGENTQNGGFNETKFRTMLDRLFASINKASQPTIVLRNSFWSGNEQANAVLASYASQKGYKFASMDDIRERSDYKASQYSNAGVAHHPNDAGHAAMAARVLAQLVNTSGGTTPPASGAVPTLAGGWAEGTLAQLYALAPFVPTNNQVGSWAPNTEQLLSNSQAIIGIRNSVGGSITRTVDKRWPGINLVNSNALGNDGQYGKEDGGREEDFSAYGHPDGGPEPPIGHPYTQDGQTTDIRVSGDDTGFNPVPGTSRFLDRPVIEWFERQTVNGREVMYTRTQPYHWSLHAGKSQTRRHAWHWLEGLVHKWVYLYENFRSDSQAINELRQQEGPMSHIIGDCYRQFVSFAPDGVAPTEITVQPPYEKNQADTGNKLTTGSWIGAYDNQSRGYALIAPYCSLMGGKQQIGQAGNEFSYSTSYICVRLTMDFDTPTNFMVSGSKLIGTLSELQDYLRANPVDHRPFKYNFDGGLFQGWCSINGYLRRVGSEAVFGIGSGKGHNPSERGAAKLFSPFGHYVAAQTPVLYLNMAVTGNTQLFIGFQKTGQAEGDVFPNGQYKVINVTGDGQYRTYAVDLSGTSGYSGIVGQYFIQNPIGYSPSGSETIKLGWFNTQNQKP